MSDRLSHNIFVEDLFGDSGQSSGITQAELDEAESLNMLPRDDPVNFRVRLEESREGEARTTKVKPIEGPGPGMITSEVFSMDRLLWADGVLVNKTGAEATNTKATLAVLKVNVISRTQSSGGGSDRPVRRARIQVELHGTGSDAHKVEAKRPCLVGWAPYAKMERPNMTTAKHSSSRSVNARLRAGMTEAGVTAQATASSTREWEMRYFDEYQSRPLSVMGAQSSGSESSNFNGVVWTMAMNSQQREGIVPELLMYVLMTRQDDSEYAVKVTATIERDGLLKSFASSQKHQCVLRVTPAPPPAPEEPRGKPAVCYLEGDKMWETLDVNHFERLLSPKMDSSLVLPWDTESTAHAKGAKSGAALENEAAEGDEDDDGEAEGGDAAQTEPNATLSVAVSLTKESSAEPTPAGPATGRDAATPLADKIMLDTLLGLSERGGEHNNDEEEETLPTRMAMMESRMELMEYRMARQALVIRALLKHKGR